MTGPAPLACLREACAGLGRVGIAVSGGGDSIAALVLAVEALGAARVRAVTVDHGLRPEAAHEAAGVAALCARLGVPHAVLRWAEGAGGHRGNLMGAARAARYALIGDWARAGGLDAVILAHTQDDQAETVLMRLARGSGVDGLSAMSEGRYGRDDILRPVLDESRADLRIWLTRQGMRWIEDPSNDDPRYDRVRARRLLTQLAPFGIDAGRLAETATAMSRARRALLARAADVADRIVTDRGGLLIFDLDGLEQIEQETRLRLVAHGLACLSGAPYKPRLASLSATLDRAFEGQGGTLQGCRLIPVRNQLLIVREFNSVEALACAADGQQVWDARWCIDAPGQPGATVRALGAAGMAQWDRPAAFPHAALLSFPGVWLGDLLLAVPGFWNDDAIRCEYAASAGFHAAIKSH